MNTVNQNQLRRSPLYRWHVQHNAQYAGSDTIGVVSSYGDSDLEIQQAQQLALCDLSLLARAGFKGKGASAWLATQAAIPARVNQAMTQSSGDLIARLSNEEYLMIDRPDSLAETVAINLDSGFSGALHRQFLHDKPPRTYDLLRSDSHCLFAMSGYQVPDMLAKVCAIDMATGVFKCGAVAQTSVARLNAILLRTGNQPVPVYYLLTDISAAEYMWNSLQDAMREYESQPVGLSALLATYTLPG